MAASGGRLSNAPQVAADLLDSSIKVSPSIAEDGVDPHHEGSGACKRLEYSFLADALVATGILVTPPADRCEELFGEGIAAAADGSTPNSSDGGGNAPPSNEPSSRRELDYASIGATKPAGGRA